MGRFLFFMVFARSFQDEYRRTLRVSLLAVVLTAGVCLVATGFMQPASGQSLFISSVSSTLYQNFKQPNTTTGTTAATNNHSVSIPRCTRIDFGTPSPLSLDNAPTGLSQQNDLPSYYRIYGNTADQIHSQLKNCGPGAAGGTDAEFTGQTDYNLDWQYDMTEYNNVCTLTNIKVGLHTSIAIPYWQPTSSVTTGLSGRWQRFASGLQTHEEGHVSIDKAYAARLVSDLSNLSSMPCDQVASTVHTIASADTAALDYANNDYDVRTNHGATQGAVLPEY